MAIDVKTLVMDQLDPVSGLDSSISPAVDRAIEAQTALHEFGSIPDDQQKVLLSLYVLRQMIPRLSLKFALKIRDVESAKARARYDRAVDYLKLLAKNVEDELKAAQKEVTPEDIEGENPAWPGIGPMEWEDPDS